jgi:hypothetical protein
MVLRLYHFSVTINGGVLAVPYHVAAKDKKEADKKAAHFLIANWKRIGIGTAVFKIRLSPVKGENDKVII